MEEKASDIVAEEGAGNETELTEGPTTGVGAFEFDAVDGRKSSYVGEWALVKGTRVRQGHGKYQFSDGKECYEGNWFGDEMHGQGKYCFCTGAIYEGNFEHNKLSGFGKYSWVDGAFYEGEWLNNRMHGRGTYTTKDGVRWEGDFLNGKFLDGKGTYVDVRTTLAQNKDTKDGRSTGHIEEKYSGEEKSDVKEYEEKSNGEKPEEKSSGKDVEEEEKEPDESFDEDLVSRSKAEESPQKHEPASAVKPNATTVL